ncbi:MULTISPECIES: HEAT repeat domain-containing protein [Streptomyces]|uniref:HEAT repeat domain-containing protein n=2 Tax=Streptomyces TaxID=1883 RepID=UPI001929AAFD|nr:hypothetical protein [Streptomyces sp. KY75]
MKDGMGDWVVAALCPHDVVPINGREAGYSSSATALSYVIMGRLMEYDIWRGQGSSQFIPDLLGDLSMPNSEWEFVRSALRSTLEDTQEMGARELSRIVSDDTFDAELRTVSCILASISYADMEMYEQAVEICEVLLERQLELDVLQRGLLQLQAGLRNAEVKDYSRALEWASSASRTLNDVLIERDSVLFKALEGLQYSAQDNIDAFSEMLSGEFKLFSRRDRSVAPSYWMELGSTAGSAALEYMSEDFKKRIRDRALRMPPRVLVNEDYISRNLYAYYMRVQVAGHWHKYLGASQQLGKERMLRRLDDQDGGVAQLRQGLAYLRKGWASSAYTEGLRLVREEGPLDALENELQKSLERLQREVTDLEFHVLRVGAPLLRSEEADSVIRSLLEKTLPSHARRAHGWYRTEVPLWDSVAAMAREISDGDYLSRRIRAAVGGENSTESFHIRKVVEILDWSLVSVCEQDAWSELFRSRSVVADDWKSLLDSVLYAICKVGNPAALDLLRASCQSEMTLERAAQIVDLSSGSDVDLLEIFSASISELCAAEMGEIRNQAKQGSWSLGGYNPALIGAALSIKSPDNSVWSDVSDFLRDPLVAKDEKDSVLEFLAFRVADIPAGVLQGICSDPDRLTSASPGIFAANSGRESGALFRFLCAAGAIGADEALASLVRFSSGLDFASRIEAVRSLPASRRVLGDALAIGYMMQMTVDPSVFVRAEAAEILGNFLDSDIENQRFLTQRLVQLLGSDGVAVPFGALRGLLRAKRNGAVLVGSEVAGELRNIARNHSIVRVRQVANSLLA